MTLAYAIAKGWPIAGGQGSVTLNALSFSSSTVTIGSLLSGTILGATSGSTIVAAGLPTGFTVNGAARTWAYDGTGTALVATGAQLTETRAGANNSPRVSSTPITVQAAGPGLNADSYGINMTPESFYGTTRKYVNMARQGRMIDNASTPIYAPANLDDLGNLISCPAGTDIALLVGRPNRNASQRMKITWTGTMTWQAVQGDPAKTISSGAGFAVVTVDSPADPEGYYLGGATYKWNGVSGGTLGNINIQPVDIDDVMNLTDTWDAPYISRHNAAGPARFVGVEGGSVNSELLYIPLTWAKRSKLASSRPNPYFDQATLTHGSGASLLDITARKSPQTPYISLAYNNDINYSKALAAFGMSSAAGANGNNVSLTILTPSGTGSVVVTKTGNSIDIVQTPHATGALAANLANQINFDPVAQALVYVAGGQLNYALFTAQPAAASTLTLGGTVFTFVASGPTGNQILIGASAGETAQNAATKIAAVLANTRTDVSSTQRLNIYFLSGATQTLSASGGANVTIVTQTGTGTPGTKAKTYLAGGSDPLGPEGMGVEKLVAEANAANQSMDWAVPANWDDAGLASAFAYIYANLNSNLKLNVSCGNEVWNDSIPFYYDRPYYAGRGFQNGAPGGSTFDYALLVGYAWEMRRVFTAAKTAFAGNPARLRRICEGIQTADSAVNYVDAFLKRTGAGSDPLLTVADYVDALAFAPYYGSFGLSNQKNAHPGAGVFFPYLAHCYSLVTNKVYFAPVAFTTDTLANDVAAGRLLEWTPANVDKSRLVQIQTVLETAKILATRIKSYVNENGVAIQADIYECGQSDIIDVDAPGKAIYDAYILAMYRSPYFLKWEGIYNYELKNYAGVNGLIKLFNSYQGGHWEASNYGNWGMIESPSSPDANGPRMRALVNSRNGVFPVFYRPSAQPTVTGVRQSGSVLTLNLPTFHNATAISIQRTKDGANVGAAIDGMPGGVPLTSLTYTQVVGDETHFIDWVITGTGASLGSFANPNTWVHNTNYNVQTTAPVVFETEFQNWLNALTAAGSALPTTNAQGAINAFYAAMKSSSSILSHPSGQTIWQLTGVLANYKAHTAIARLINYKGSSVLTPQGSPPFTAFTGLVTDGNGSNYFTRANGFADVPGFDNQADAGWSIWLKNDSAQPEDIGVYHGTGSGSNDFFYTKQGGSGVFRVGGTNLANPEIGTGALVSLNRTDASTVKTYINGSSEAVNSNAADGLVLTTDLTYMKPLAGNSGAILSFERIGKSLNAAQEAYFAAALVTLHANIGT